MVAGIIIDTFKALKNKMQEKNKDEKKICFICGISREKLDKGANGFFQHIKVGIIIFKFN